MSFVEREDIQRQIQKDWANREYIWLISGSINKIADFLNSFDASTRGKLNKINERLNVLERKVEFIEAMITQGETLN